MRHMAEAEVSLRLASWLIAQGLVKGVVEVAIDGAQVRTGDKVHFDLAGFLLRCGWVKQSSGAAWQGTYRSAVPRGELRVHSKPGRGPLCQYE